MIQKVTYKTVVDDYCDSVAGGSIVACEVVKKAVQRYYSDLARVGDVDFPYYFDWDAAEWSCMFFPAVLRHSIGEWQGQPFQLSPWQAFIHWNVYGWKRNDDHSRRFRKVLVSIARKNGKTTYCAGTSIQSATCDINPNTGKPESVAQVFIGATKINQAKIMFDETARMAKQSHAISRACEVTQQSIFFPGTQSTIAPLASDRPFSGLGPSSMLFDEMHEFTERHRKFYETMTTGSGSRVQPLQWIITTASDDKGLIYHEEFNYARKVLDGVVKDEQLFAIIFELDKDDDVFDESVWIKANPNLHTSVKIDYLRDQANEAKNKPSKKAPFERFHCNRCVKSTEESVVPKTGKLSDWSEATAVGFGVDLGGMDDLASFAKVARFQVGEKFDDDGKASPVWRFEAKSHSFMSEQTRRDLTVQPWTTWIADGELNVAQYVFSELQDELKHDMDAELALHFAYDPQFAGQLAENMENDGYVPVKMPQRQWAFNEPMLELYAAIAEGRFLIDERDRVLLWAFSNMTINRDTVGRMMPDKGKSKDKIDPAVAVIMALKACLAVPDRFTGSLFLS